MSIRDTLEQIESKASWARMDAMNLAAYVNRLPAQRSYLTNARDALALAEIELAQALETVRAAAKRYDALPVNDKAA